MNPSYPSNKTNTKSQAILGSIRRKITWLLTFVILVGLAATILHFYSYVFSRKVSGEVIGLDRVIQPSTIVGLNGQVPASQVFSFAVAIKEPTSGEIVTSSSEDRQWAVVEKGQCAEARFFPYPPWELDKSGTYFGARLLRLYDCPPK